MPAGFTYIFFSIIFSLSVSAKQYCILASFLNLIIVFFIMEKAGRGSWIQNFSPRSRSVPSSEVMLLEEEKEEEEEEEEQLRKWEVRRL